MSYTQALVNLFTESADVENVDMDFVREAHLNIIQKSMIKWAKDDTRVLIDTPDHIYIIELVEVSRTKVVSFTVLSKNSFQNLGFHMELHSVVWLRKKLMASPDSLVEMTDILL